MTYRFNSFIALGLLACAHVVHAQVVQMGEANATLCSGVFIDDGDEGDPNGGPYSNTDYTITICPITPGDAISVTFTSFDLQTNPNPNNNDVLIITTGTPQQTRRSVPAQGTCSSARLQWHPSTIHQVA